MEDGYESDAPATIADVRAHYQSLSMRLETQLTSYLTARGRAFPEEGSEVLAALAQLEARVVRLEDPAQIAGCAAVIAEALQARIGPAVAAMRRAEATAFGAARDVAAGALADGLAGLVATLEQGAQRVALGSLRTKLGGWQRAFFVRIGPADESAPAPVQAAFAPRAASDMATRGDAAQALGEIRAGIQQLLAVLATYDLAVDKTGDGVAALKAHLRGLLAWFESPAVHGWQAPEYDDPIHLLGAAQAFANLPTALRAQAEFAAERSPARVLALAEAIGDVVAPLGLALQDAPAPACVHGRFLAGCQGAYFSGVSRALVAAG